MNTPTGSVLNVTDSALGAELYPSGVHIIKQDRGIFDTFPLSLITTQTIACLSEKVGLPLGAHRFRPNIQVEAVDETEFPEDSWLGCVLRIGSIRMHVDKRDGRCIVITIDPVTSERTPAILRTVAMERQGCLGVYGSTVTPGRVALDDQVFIETFA